METYRVPQRKIPVRVALADGVTLDGALFAPAAGPDGAPGRLIDRLNEEQEHFLALAGAARDNVTALVVDFEVASR